MTHPYPRPGAERELAPSVHWAQLHHNIGGSVIERALYDFELLYIVRGALVVRYEEGGPVICGETGDLLLLPSAVRHRIEGAGEPSSTLIGIHFDFFDELEIAQEQDILVQEEAEREGGYCRFPVDAAGAPLFGLHYPQIGPDAATAMDTVVAEFAAGRPGGALVCRGALLQIFALLLRQASEERTRRAAAGHGRAMLGLARRIEDAPGEAWANGRMAASLHLSEDHFIRQFKETLGVSPHSFVQAARYREAKRLLKDTDEKIEAIANAVGYADLHAFSHSFKRWQGVSPREYRKLCRLI